MEAGCHHGLLRGKTNNRVMVLDIPNATMGMHRLDAIRAGLISGHRHSAFAGVDRFVCVKAEASYLAARADHSLAGAGGKGLYRIFHDADDLFSTAIQNALTIRPRQLASLATKNTWRFKQGALRSARWLGLPTPKSAGSNPIRHPGGPDRR